MLTKNQFVILNDEAETIGDSSDSWLASIIARVHSRDNKGGFRVLDREANFKTVAIFQEGARVQ